MNLRVYNALRKIAADQAVKEQQSEVPFDEMRYWRERLAAERAENDRREAQNGEGFYGNARPTKKFYTFGVNNQSDYERRRPTVASYLAQKYMKLVPGSDKFSQAVKYFMNRGDTTMYNNRNPSNPRPNPEVPAILKDREQETESVGNLIGSTNYGKKYSTVS